MKGWIGVRQARWLSMLVLSAWLALAAAHAAPPPEPGFTPDPATVQRWGAGWRYPQAGWTVIHIEGPPRERGLQHGHLMATEIAAYIRALSEFWGPQAPAAAWAQNRAVARRLFEKGFPTEPVQEMQGIAEGANAAGARAHGRPLDVLDIITLNTSNEIDTVHDALLVTPDAPDIRVATQQPLDPSLRVVEAARLLQTALRRREHNVQPPIKPDREVSDDDLRGHHLLLVGRPSTNAVSQRFAAQWGVDFGARSFTVRGQRYTHPESAVLAAGDNPLDARWSVVLVAGLSSLGTYQVVGRFADDLLTYAPLVIAPFGRDMRDVVPPLPELMVVPVIR